MSDGKKLLKTIRHTSKKDAEDLRTRLDAERTGTNRNERSSQGKSLSVMPDDPPNIGLEDVTDEETREVIAESGSALNPVVSTMDSLQETHFTQTSLRTNLSTTV
jgi:hypothetical protein